MFKINTLKQLDIYNLKGSMDEDTYIIFYGPYSEVGKIVIRKEDKLYIDMKIYELINNKYTYEDILSWILDSMGLFHYNMKEIVINNNVYINRYHNYMSIMENEYDSYINYLKSISANWSEETNHNNTVINSSISKKNNVVLDFNYDGQITYTNVSNPSSNYYNLKISYDIIENKYKLSLNSKHKNGDYRYIRLSDDSRYISFGENYTKIIYDKESDLLSYCGLKRLGNNINMFLDTKVHNDKMLDSTVNICLLDKNAFYEIHIGKSITISYIDSEKSELLYDIDLKEDMISLSILDDLISKIIVEKIIPLGVVINEELLLNSAITGIYDKCLISLKQIVGEIKLPYLKTLINESTRKNEKILVNKLN